MRSRRSLIRSTLGCLAAVIAGAVEQARIVEKTLALPETTPPTFSIEALLIEAEPVDGWRCSRPSGLRRCLVGDEHVHRDEFIRALRQQMDPDGSLGAWADSLEAMPLDRFVVPLAGPRENV